MLISDNQIAVWDIYDKKRRSRSTQQNPSNSMKKKLAFQLKGTGNKFKVTYNRVGENKDLSEGHIIELYNKDDKLMMQMTQDYNSE